MPFVWSAREVCAQEVDSGVLQHRKSNKPQEQDEALSPGESGEQRCQRVGGKREECGLVQAGRGKQAEQTQPCLSARGEGRQAAKAIQPLW